MPNYFPILILLVTCNTPSISQQKPDTNRFPNVVKVEIYGDTTRLEIEKRGDTLIKHFIDIYGLQGDNFDDSFTATCTYKKIRNDSTIQSNLYFEEGEYRVFFRPRDVIAFCDKALKPYPAKDTGVTTSVNLDAQGLRFLKSHAQGKLERSIDGYWLSDLLLHCKASAINTKTQERPRAILIEFYRTEFSGGKNFSLIMAKGDTVAFASKMDWIR